MDIKQKFRNWKSNRHYNHDAYRDVLMYDETGGRFILERSTVKQKDTEPGDKIVLNDTYHYFVSEIPPQPRQVRDDEGHIMTTPISDYQFAMNNDVNDATIAIIKPQKNATNIIMGIVAGLGVAVVGYFIFTMVL